MGFFSDAVQGGGFFQGVTAKVVKSYYGYNDYNGQYDETPGLYWICEAPRFDDPVSLFWSAGGADKWDISKDGKSLKGKKKGARMDKRCALYLHMQHLLDAGAPLDLIDGIDADASVFVGGEFTFTRIYRNDEDKNGIPVVEEIITLAGETMDAEAEAVKVMLGILADKGDLQTKSLPTAVRQALKKASYDADTAKAIRGFLLDMDWVSAGVDWTVADGTIRAA